MNKQIIFFWVLTVLVTSSCDNKNSKQTYSDQSTDSAVSTLPENPADKGKELYIVNCSACHGVSGDAGIGGAFNLQATKLDSVGLSQVISNGKRNMPAFNDRLNEEETAQIVSFIKTLNNK